MESYPSGLTCSVGVVPHLLLPNNDGGLKVGNLKYAKFPACLHVDSRVTAPGLVLYHRVDYTLAPAWEVLLFHGVPQPFVCVLVAIVL